MIKINENKLKDAAERGFSEFIHLFYNEYMDSLCGGEVSDNMHMFNGEQHTLIAYCIFKREIIEGGFCQLIQNGYGGYIFDNPFAKAIRIWGADELSKLIYKAKKVFDENREDLEKERDEEEFMAMYEQHEIFDDIEEEIMNIEEKSDCIIATYIDDNIERFCVVEKM